MTSTDPHADRSGDVVKIGTAVIALARVGGVASLLIAGPWAGELGTRMRDALGSLPAQLGAWTIVAVLGRIVHAVGEVRHLAARMLTAKEPPGADAHVAFASELSVLARASRTRGGLLLALAGVAAAGLALAAGTEGRMLDRASPHAVGVGFLELAVIGLGGASLLAWGVFGSVFALAFARLAGLPAPTDPRRGE